MTVVAEAALRAVKAAYAPAETEEAWLQGICTALDEAQVGTWHGYTSADQCIRAGTGPFARDMELVRSVNASMPPHLFVAAHVPSPVVESSRAR